MKLRRMCFTSPPPHHPHPRNTHTGFICFFLFDTLVPIVVWHCLLIRKDLFHDSLNTKCKLTDEVMSRKIHLRWHALHMFQNTYVHCIILKDTWRVLLDTSFTERHLCENVFHCGDVEDLNRFWFCANTLSSQESIVAQLTKYVYRWPPRTAIRGVVEAENCTSRW